MTTRYVEPNGTGSGLSPGDRANLRDAWHDASPGDTLLCASGTYPDDSDNRIDNKNDPGPSGSPTDGNIVLQGEDATDPPVFRSRFDLRGLSYFHFLTAKHDTTDGDGWFTDGTSPAEICHHVTIEDWECHQSVKLSDRDGHENHGIHLTGGHAIHLKDVKIRDWYAFEAIRFYRISDSLIERCDWTQARAGHSILALEWCSQIVVRKIPVTNPWDRIFNLNDGTVPNRTEDCLFDELVLIDGDWDQVSSHPYNGWTDDGSDLTDDRGAGQVVRWGCADSIFRNIALIGSRAGQIAQEKGAFHGTMYSANRTYTGNRIYGIVLHDSDTRGFYAEDDGDETGTDTSNNKWRNCSISDCTRNPGSGGDGAGEFRVRHDIVDWQSWDVETCNLWHALAGDNVIDIDGETPEEYTAADADSKYSEFSNLRQYDPQFVDDTLLSDFRADPSSYDFGLLAEALAAYSLQDDTNGHGEGTHLAKVTEASSGSVITVDDAKWFWAGNSFTLGDSVTIVDAATGDEVTARVVSRTDTSLSLDQDVTVSVDDLVYLTAMGTTPSIGLFQDAGEAPVPPTITSTPPTEATEDEEYTYQAQATGDTPITWSLDVSPAGMTVDSDTGLVTWTPTVAPATEDVTLKATNSAGNDTQSWTITVSAAPAPTPSASGPGEVSSIPGPRGGMRLPAFKRFRRSEHPDAPEGWERWVESQEYQIERLTQLLQNNMSFGDQFNSEVREVAMSDGQSSRFRLAGITGDVRGIIVLGARGEQTGSAYHAKERWAPVDEGAFDLTVDFEPTPTENVLLTLMAYGE